MDTLPIEQPAPALPPDDSKKPSGNDKLYKIIIGALTLLSIVLLILVFVFSSQRSVSQQQLNVARAEGQKEGAIAQKELDEQNFAKIQNSDLKVYTAPSAAGEFKLSIPKSWSLSVTPEGPSSTISGLSMPDYIDTKAALFALRFDLKEEKLEEVKKDYDDEVKSGKLRAEDVTVSGIKGFKYTGQIESEIPNGTAVLVPLRDKTFVIQTDDNTKYLTVFNSILSTLQLNP